MGTMMQFRTWLVDSEPEVWRRLILDPRLTVAQLHTALQCAFGWTNSHLHQFHEKDGRRYVMRAPRGYDFGYEPKVPTIDERKVLLADVFDRPKKIILYEYDFGDSWMHCVQFEKTVDSETVEYPGETFIIKGRGMFSAKERAAMCIGGARNGPPEDCGGIFGYERCLQVTANPPPPTSDEAEDDRSLVEWLDGWDPAHFDLAAVNQDLGRIRVKKVHLGPGGTNKPLRDDDGR